MKENFRKVLIRNLQGRFVFSPLTLPSPPNPGERIKVRGFKTVPMPVPLFMRNSLISRALAVAVF